METNTDISRGHAIDLVADAYCPDDIKVKLQDLVGLHSAIIENWSSDEEILRPNIKSKQKFSKRISETLGIEDDRNFILDVGVTPAGELDIHLYQYRGGQVAFARLAADDGSLFDKRILPQSEIS